ncbi:hypothetical protein CR205_14980 [Alteribacter lacisalsi]|uniref:Uncharacterized protein n=1 Tax=Alteribacter lacisalsi TaxID=2045244 RepID=A0A2W0H567_9BACI|nr:hypothetical protein [Alteribacter lacisalsi]PYZ96974.1 hypothetical protein CR205_14980 [Alteribacter lacisalsi]
MKQILPILLIVAVIGGAMFFFQEPAAVEEVERDWDASGNVMQGAGEGNNKWKLELWADFEDTEEPIVGFDLSMRDKERGADVEAVEVFVQFYNPMGSFYYQDLNVDEEFDGMIAIEEVCTFCSKDAFDDSEMYYGTDGDSDLFGYITIAWREDGTTYESGTDFSMPGKILNNEDYVENDN